MADKSLCNYCQISQEMKLAMPSELVQFDGSPLLKGAKAACRQFDCERMSNEKYVARINAAQAQKCDAICDLRNPLILTFACN